MAFELRPNSGSLFPNQRQRPGKQDPNADGRILLSRELIEQLYHQGGDGTIKVSAWTKGGQNGAARWQSLSVRPWEDRPQEQSNVGRHSVVPSNQGQGNYQGQGAYQNQGRAPAPQASPFDDDIPF
jgi:hypothetical protein